MKDFFKLVLLIVAICCAVHFYNTNREARKAADSAVDTVRQGTKAVLREADKHL